MVESNRARPRAHGCSRAALQFEPPVLPRATTSPRKRVQATVKRGRLSNDNAPHNRQERRIGAKASERRCRLDKLGVTGPSPVPPIESTCTKRKRCCEPSRLNVPER